MIFVDSNIPMYLVGAPHPHKNDAQLLLERFISSGQKLLTDAEVFQEIIHRFAAIGKREAIGPAFEVLLDVVDAVLPIEKTDVIRAGEIAQNRAMLSGRDSLHIAVMERYKVSKILTFDADFDRWPGLKRLHKI